MMARRGFRNIILQNLVPCPSLVGRQQWQNSCQRTAFIFQSLSSFSESAISQKR